MASKTEKKTKPAVKKTAAEKPAPKTKSAAPAKKPVKKAAVKPAVKEAPVKKAAVKPAVKKAPVKKAAVKPVAKPAAKKAPVKKASVGKAAAEIPAKKTAAKKTISSVAKKAVAGRKAGKPVPRVKAAALVVPVVSRPIATPVYAGESAEVRRPVHTKLRLTKTQQKHYTSLLMNERKRFMNQLQFHRADVLSAKKDSAGERAGMATHMADLGSDNFRHDMELTLLSEEGDVIQMIDEALQKIQDSEYGICVECGCAINPERLEAKPYARFCVRCKDKHEKLEEPHRRHR